MPFNNYTDPWVNSLFQDAQPLAKGIFEGVAHEVIDEVRAMRTARLELDDAYDPARHLPVMQRLTWDRLTKDELGLMPTIMTIGGDGASYDIGFGAMSRVLASQTPVKIMVLNSGAYSNTGGQTSTASFTGQDSDLSRFGGAHDGKHESRKELGLHRVLPPGRLRGFDVHGDPRALPQDDDGVPQLHRGPGRDGHLHAVRIGERHRRGGLGRQGAARRRVPDEPAVRARPPRWQDAARLVQPRRQSRPGPDVDAPRRSSTSTRPVSCS